MLRLSLTTHALAPNGLHDLPRLLHRIQRLTNGAQSGCSRSVRKQNPRSFSPTISGSSTAGAQGALRDQSPRGASRKSPLRTPRKALFSNVVLLAFSLGNSSPRNPAGDHPTCVYPHARALASNCGEVFPPGARNKGKGILPVTCFKRSAARAISSQ